MRKIVSILLVIILILSLAGCRKNDEPKTLYQSDILTVTRCDRSICVFDVAAHTEHTFLIKRVRKAKNGIKTGTAVETQNLTIYPAGSVLFIVEKKSQNYILVKVRS